jgi:hypothetical protein
MSQPCGRDPRSGRRSGVKTNPIVFGDYRPILNLESSVKVHFFQFSLFEPRRPYFGGFFNARGFNVFRESRNPRFAGDRCTGQTGAIPPAEPGVCPHPCRKSGKTAYQNQPLQRCECPSWRRYGLVNKNGVTAESVAATDRTVTGAHSVVVVIYRVLVSYDG